MYTEQPWLLDKSPNEVLSDFLMFCYQKNQHRSSSYLTIVYRFWVYMLSIGFLIISYVYVTRLDKNCSEPYFFNTVCYVVRNLFLSV